MKTLAFLISACALSFNTLAGNIESNEHGDKYCAKTKNGKLTIMHEGKELTSDVTLSNGTRIAMNGTITKTDGTTMIIKDGECIDLEGKIEKPTIKKQKTGTDKKKQETSTGNY